MFDLHVGECLEVLRTLPAGSQQTCVTSPPYFGLRDYNVEGQIGLEETPEAFVAKLVEVFREVRRVLRDDGTCWINLGDSYAGNGAAYDDSSSTLDGAKQSARMGARRKSKGGVGLKAKDLIGIPWMVAFALRADGWYLRQDIIWHKPNPMPESVTDRCTKAHEYLFLLSKSKRYYFDAKAIAEPAGGWNGSEFHTGKTMKHQLDRASTKPRQRVPSGWDTGDGGHRELVGRYGKSGNKARKPATERGCPQEGVAGSVPWEGDTRNKRDVWTVPTFAFPGAHFATYPPKLIEPCILAGAPEGGVVLDPFTGSGTTGEVALKHGRKFVGIELSPEYAEMARRRITAAVPPLFRRGT